ncbi:MAG: 3-deoxy-D-manno-octulosonate 8-phosphate phosphatase [Bacteroidota bacterium]|nr:3-deoxy-D-manno-octulosonate 8-phosphate phosphatase [Bacteroidota bacterium]
MDEANILEKFKLVKTFVFDMDGVLTDGSLLILNDNEWLRTMDIKDGYAMHVASNHKYRMVVISGSSSEPARKRLNHLGVTDVFMGVDNKRDLLQKYISEHTLHPLEVLYMGDDIPDYGCMNLVGMPCCPADAAAQIRQIAKYISPYKGGEGCVRDVIEKVLMLHDKWEVG